MVGGVKDYIVSFKKRKDSDQNIRSQEERRLPIYVTRNTFFIIGKR